MTDSICEHITIPDIYPAGSICNCGAVKCQSDTYDRVVHSMQLGNDQMIWTGTMPLIPAIRYDVHSSDGYHFFSITHRNDKPLGKPGDLIGTVYESIEAHAPGDT